jgi:hypothetical protein
MTTDEVPLAPPRVGRSLARGALTGGAAGSAFGLFAGVVYVAENARVALPWQVLAPAFAAYALLSGVLLGGSVAGAIALFDSVAGRRIASAPLPAATLGGALGALLPGAVGVGGFGALSAPFMGGLAIFAIPVVAATLIASALAVQDRGEGGKEPRAFACILTALGIAFALAGLSWLVAHRIGDAALLDVGRDLSRGLSANPTGPGASVSGLVYLGLLGGAGLGAVIGLYVGAVVATSRALR